LLSVVGFATIYALWSMARIRFDDNYNFICHNIADTPELQMMWVCFFYFSPYCVGAGSTVPTFLFVHSIHVLLLRLGKFLYPLRWDIVAIKIYFTLFYFLFLIERHVWTFWRCVLVMDEKRAMMVRLMVVASSTHYHFSWNIWAWLKLFSIIDSPCLMSCRVSLWQVQL